MQVMNSIPSIPSSLQNVAELIGRKQEIVYDHIQPLCLDPAADTDGMITTVPPPLPPRSFRRVLVFDTETTGLMPKRAFRNMPINEIELPHITQLTYILYDIEQRCILQVFNSYVKLPDTVEIPELVTEITGITTEKCEMEGRDICDVLRAFYAAYESADCVVAHNITFDTEMLHLECTRHSNKLIGECPNIMKMLYLCDKMRECTMQLTTAFCNLYKTNVRGRPYLKMPKLVELHEKLFGTIPANLHNSLVDTLVCLRCYLKFRWSIEIEDYDALVESLVLIH